MRLVTNVHSTSPMGGVELNVFQVSRELARRGHQVNLIYREAGTLVPDYRKFCQSVTKVPDVDYWYPTGRRGRPKQMAMMVPAAMVAVRRRPDLIYGNRIMSTGWAVPAGKVAGAPVVCHEHGHSDHLDTARSTGCVAMSTGSSWSPTTSPDCGWPRGWTPTGSTSSSTGWTRPSTPSAATRSDPGLVTPSASAANRSSSPTSDGSTARRVCTSCSRPGADSTSVPTRPGCWWWARRPCTPMRRPTGPSWRRWPPTPCGSSLGSVTW